MIHHPAFSIEPWCLRETRLDLDILAQTESLFALSNGHVGWRGNLDEGDPHAIPGSYVNGVHELRTRSWTDESYDRPDAEQVLVDVTNGKLIRLMVEDEHFDVRTGVLHSHQRVLDFRAGVLDRRFEWSSPAGKTVRVRSTRLVSLVQRSVAAIAYQVEAVGQPVRVVLQSELLTNEAMPPPSGDPRESSMLGAPWQPLFHAGTDTAVRLVHRTERSRLMVGAGMDHQVTGPPTTGVVAESFDDLGRLTVTVTLQPGECLRLIKYVAYNWAEERSVPALTDEIDVALAEARRTGWEGLLAAQKATLAAFWKRADVKVDGDPEIQQAVRFALFHVLQASIRAEQCSIPAKGLTGPGYDGHTFWDTETFVLPVLTYLLPDAAGHALTWRHATMPLAMARAGQLGLRGAAFPWRTITGVACSSYWPAGTAAFHVGADIADAVMRYSDATGDVAFREGVGLELLVQTARLWHSLGHFQDPERFRIDGVTGPDEYSAIADNNVYTNLMAQRNLRGAADAAAEDPDRAARLGVTGDEVAAWRAAAAAMVVPRDETLGVHAQSEGFTAHERWDFEAVRPDQYPLLLHFPYFDLYRKQVVKQADLVLAMHLRGDAFTPEEKEANFDYYERLTVRDSSLSACTQAVMAAEVGHLDLAYDYLADTALMDLGDLEHNTSNGLHVASLAGTWIALVNGLAGMRERDGTLGFAPRLPPGWTRLAFGIELHGSHLRVEVGPTSTRYRVTSGDPLELFHFGSPFTVAAGAPALRATPADAMRTPAMPPPPHPVGREPARRRFADLTVPG
jgi:alpha,alpha-trehalose phosphorylase